MHAAKEKLCFFCKLLNLIVKMTSTIVLLIIIGIFIIGSHGNPEVGFRNFISQTMSSFPDWISDKNLEPTPELDKEFGVNITSGFLTLNGTFNNVRIQGLSRTRFNTYFGLTSFADLRIGFSVIVSNIEIAGSYNATGLAFGEKPIGGNTIWLITTDELIVTFFADCYYEDGKITLRMGMSGIHTDEYEFKDDALYLTIYFHRLFASSPDISYENENYILNYIGRSMPSSVFNRPDNLIFHKYFFDYLQQAFSVTPVMDIISWPAPTTPQPTETTTEESENEETDPPLLTTTLDTVPTDLPTTEYEEQPVTETLPNTQTTTPTRTTHTPTRIPTSTTTNLVPTQSTTTPTQAPKTIDGISTTTELNWSPPPAKYYSACNLAIELTEIEGDSVHWNTYLEEWLCLAEMTTNFNAAFMEMDRAEMDSGLVYYGIFKISNRWCRDENGNHRVPNPCNIDCQDLVEHMEPNILCSQHIFNQSGFAEWPEYEERCFNPSSNYLVDCHEAPFFIPPEEFETSKVFAENSNNESISCLSQGFPLPEMQWDNDTMLHVNNSNERLQLNLTRRKEFDGNWTMLNTITFTTVYMSDGRMYTCHSKNFAGDTNLGFMVKVVSRSGDAGSSWGLPTIISISVAMCLLIPIGFLLYRRRKKNLKLIQIQKEFKYGLSRNSLLEANNEPSLFDASENNLRALQMPFQKSMEIFPARLSLKESVILGRGAFGIVYKGFLDGKVVAVKTLTNGANESKLAALLSEVKIMSYVGNHPNLVKFFGAQLKDLRKGTVYVVVEFCLHGSLHDFLQEKRKHLERNPEYFGPVVDLPGYLNAPLVVKPMSTMQLLICVHQVCSAMEFLESKRIIHGDLAARNVLLDKNMVAKISDFGLSHQIYDSYKKYVLAAKETELPWRWLAIETLKHLKFSTESDIWAFGVFMWEVFSLGDIPYSAGINWSADFVKYLERGFRLEMPEYANEDACIYYYIGVWNVL